MKRYQYLLISLGLIIIICFCLFKDSIFKQKENFQSTFSPIMSPHYAATNATGSSNDEDSLNNDENDSTHFITQNPNEIAVNMPTSLNDKNKILNKFICSITLK